MVKYHGESIIGGRSENQDSIAFTDVKFGFLAIVCDGMGGGKGGKMASQIAIDIILEDIGNSASEDPVNAIYNAIQKANFEIFRTGLNDEDLKGMGTTVALALITEREALVAHVGDSRVYQVRAGKIIRRTYDHSVVFRMLKDGILTSEEQASKHPKSNEITRALGLKPVVDIEMEHLSFEKGDFFFLCSDGVNGELSEEEITQLHKGNIIPRNIAIKAVNNANHKGLEKGGGHDNASAISIFCEKRSVNQKTAETSVGNPKLKYKPSLIVGGILGIALLIALYSITALKSSNEEYIEQLQSAHMELKKQQINIDSLRTIAETVPEETSLREAIPEDSSAVAVSSFPADTIAPATRTVDSLNTGN